MTHDDRAALDIAAEARLKHRGQQQDEEQYELAEPPELAAPHQSESNQSRHHGEGTRDGPRQRTAQQGIRDGPQKPSHSPRSRDEKEQSRRQPVVVARAGFGGQFRCSPGPL